MVLSLSVRIMQAQFQKFLKQNCIYYPFNLKVFLYCCLLIIAFIITMFSFQGAKWISQETQWNISFEVLQSISFKIWWRLAGSNRWPPACKAGALPAELNPHIHSLCSGGPRTRFPAGKPRRLQQSTGLLPSAAFRVHFGFACLQNSIVSVLTSTSVCSEVVGQNGLEPSTSRLSVVCSSQLSYWPISTSLLI